MKTIVLYIDEGRIALACPGYGERDLFEENLPVGTLWKGYSSHGATLSEGQWHRKMWKEGNKWNVVTKA